ncbi:MAG: hypothetical protein JWL59_4655 [Chthoniobacteraceae bacterium]|nr:hypothetical protein [Chthoniobacteraceae bacterium]
MKIFRKLPKMRCTKGIILAGSIGALVVTALPSRAATLTWDGAWVTSGLWSVLANWVGDSAAPGNTSGTTSPEVAIFNAFGVNAWGNVAGNPIGIDANSNIFGINFTITEGLYFVAATGGNALKVSSGGGRGSIEILNTLTATNAVEIICDPLQLQGDTDNGKTTVTGRPLRLLSGSELVSGSVTIGANTAFNYPAGADTPLVIGGAFSLTGGAGTNLDGAIRSTAMSARIAVPDGGATAIGVGSPAAAATDLSATALSTAYWKGGLSGAPSTWAASNGSTQSNWVATPGGANQALIPGAETDVIFSNTTVTTSPASSRLGADMTIRSLTQQDTANPVSLNADGFSLTITPGSPTAGITMVSRTGDLTINSSVVLGAAQTWANFSSSGYLTVNGRVDNGANLLTLAGRFITISGAIGGGSGGLTMSATNLRLSGANTYTGATTINDGDVMIFGTGSIRASTSITLNNNATLMLLNGSPDGSFNRIGDDASIASNGGNFIYSNDPGASLSYTEAAGTLAINNGQTNVNLLNNMLGGSNTQRLTFGGLNQANAATVNFAVAQVGPNAATDVIQVAGAPPTPAGQIIGPWATTSSDTRTFGVVDYATYDAAGKILPAGIAASPEPTWVPATNVTLSDSGTLTATRTLNSLRYTGLSGILAMGANNLETFGILGGGLKINSSSGVVRQPGTAAANLYVTTGTSFSIDISAPIQDHGGALTLVKAGASTLTLSGPNSFTGGIVLNAGTLTLNSKTAMGTGPLTIYGGVLDTDTNFVNANHNEVIFNGDFTCNGYTLMNLGTGAISLGTAVGTTRTITINSKRLTLGGVISNGTTANAISKAGSGTLVLSGANTYTGGTTMNGGTFGDPGTLIARSGSALGLGSVTVIANGILNYEATTDVPLVIGGNLVVTGGAFTALGGAIGSVATSAQIAVTGAATATGTVKLNVFAVPGVTPLAGTNTYTLVHGGAGSSLNGAIYSMGLVVNNTNFTVSTPTVTATDLTVSVTGGVTPLSTAYWTGGLPGAISVWAASNGSTQSNWAATKGGASQPLAPGATTDVIFTAFNSSSSTLGADMSLRSITMQGASVFLDNDDGHTLTITPTSATAGITIANGGSLTIEPNILMGAAQMWSNSGFGFTVKGDVDNGGHLLTVGGDTVRINGAISGAGGLSKSGAGELTLAGENSYTGVTTLNGGSVSIHYSGGQGSVRASSGVVLNNNAVLTLDNSSAYYMERDRLGDGIPIISNGGIFNYDNSDFPGPTVYAETIGTVTAANGQTMVQLVEDMNVGRGSVQTLTLSGLSQTNAATVTFTAANVGVNTTTNIIKVTGAAQTAAGQIIGPWATTARGNTQTDYAIYDGAGRILPAGIAGSTEDNWMPGANVTLASGTALTATRTLNTLRFTGAGTLALGSNNLETFGILNGGAFLTITASSGVVRQPGSQPANLYVSGGTINAPIQDHGGALTLVKSGGSSLELSGLNTFSGGLVLNAGTLELNGNTALGSGPFTIFGGLLGTNTRFANANANAINIYGDFGIDFFNSGPIDLGTGPVTLGTIGGTTVIDFGTRNDLLTMGGVISDGTTASALVKKGAGTLMLTGANSFSGGTTIDGYYFSGSVLTVRHGSGLGTGRVTVHKDAALNYAARADTPLILGGSLSITGGAFTALGGAIGSTVTSARIAVKDAATATGPVKLNLFAVPGATPQAGTNSYTLVHGGPGSSLNGATYSLGLVLNNTDFTVGTPTATTTDLTVSVTGGLTPLTTAYWKGGLSEAPSSWAASNGSSQSNWVANSGGANQGLVPGVTTDLIFSNSAVTSSPSASMLGADMTIRSLTQQDSSSSVNLGVDGFTLTITPASPANGINIMSGTGGVTINSDMVLGAAQTWTNNTDADFFVKFLVGGQISNGTNLLTIDGTGNTTISGAIGGGAGGLTKRGGGTLTLTGANTYTGATTIDGGAVTIGASLTGAINGSRAIFLSNNGRLTLSNGASEGGVNRLGDSALITSNGGAFNYSNLARSGVVYAETVGTLALVNGQTNVNLVSSMADGGNRQTLIISGLSQANAATVSFTSPSDLDTTTNLIQVPNAVQTAAGQIIAPWATTGPSTGGPTDYALYDAAGRILPARIAASEENTWTVADNSYTLSGRATLTGTRSPNSLRYTGGTDTLALGTNNLETFGILNGGSGVLTISSASGVIRQPGTSPTNLYVIAGSNSISLSAPIQDHLGALTLVKSGASTLALSGTNSFSGGVVLNAGTLELDSNTALGAGPLTIFGGALSSLTSFANANANAVEINGDFALSGSNPINLGTGAVSLGTLPGTTRTISGSGSALTLSGVISNGTTANALAKAGTNMLVLAGANTYSGGTTVNGGTLSARHGSALGTGNVTVLANGALTYVPTSDEPLTIGAALSVSGGAMGWVIGASATSAKIAVTGAATATGAVRLNMSAAPGAILPGGVNTYTLIHGGTGSSLNGATYTLKVINNTDYTVGTPTVTATDIAVSLTSGISPLTTAYWTGGLPGATTVWAASNGSTQSNWVAASGGASQGIVPGVGASVIFSNSAVMTSPASSTLGADMTIRSLTQQDSVNAVGLNSDGFSLTIAPSSPTTGITLSSGARTLTINSNIILGASQMWTNDSTSGLLSVASNVTNGANQLNVSGTGNTTISGVIGGGPGGVSKSGSGTLTLSGANTYTGETAVMAGTLAEGATGAIANTSNLTVNGATAIFNLGSNHSDTVGTVTLQGGGRITGSGASMLMANTGQTFEMQSGSVSAILAGAGIALNKTTEGTVTLSGVNMYTGPTTVMAGTLAEGATGAIANTSNLTVNGVTAIFNLGSNHSDTVGTVTLQGGGSITGSGTSVLGANPGRTFEMQSGSVSAILAGFGIALNKTTAGTVTLSGANIYTGPTTVTAGTLLVSGSISSSAATVSNAGSTLGGTGAVRDVTVGSGTILQGGMGTVASGTLTSGGAISFIDGAIIRLTLGADGTHSSLTRTGGTWAFDNNQAFDFTIISGASNTTYNDVISGLSGSETGLESIGSWLITTAGVTGTFSYDGVGGVDLSVSIIPEPGTIALLPAGLLLLGLRRFRGPSREAWLRL